jgi:hypothetical protein
VIDDGNLYYKRLYSKMHKQEELAALDLDCVKLMANLITSLNWLIGALVLSAKSSQRFQNCVRANVRKESGRNPPAYLAASLSFFNDSNSILQS